MQRFGQLRAMAAVAAAAAPVLLAARWSATTVSTDGVSSNVVVGLPAAPMDAKDFRAFKVAKVETLSHDTKRFTIELPREDDETGMTVASFVLVRAEVDGASRGLRVPRRGAALDGSGLRGAKAQASSLRSQRGRNGSRPRLCATERG
jgi:hypothetical protein